MKLDTNRAWESGLRFCRSNKGILAALAGIFIFLPGAIFSLVHPQPALDAEASADEQRAMILEWFGDAWLLGLIVTIVSMIGTLAIYRLATRRDDATVLEALRAGLRAFLPYIGAQILFSLLMGIASAAIAFVAALLGVLLGGEVVAVILMMVLVLPLWIYFFARGCLIAPVIMAEAETNPITAIKRSFALTKGNALRIAIFIMLIVVAALIVLFVLGGLLGLIFTATAGDEGATYLSMVVFTLISTVVSVIFIAVFAAIYRQLSSEPVSGAGVPKSGD